MEAITEYMVENMAMSGNPARMYESRSRRGEELAKNKWAKYCHDIKNKSVQRETAIMIENTHQWLKMKMEETTGAQQIGNFDKFALPLVRAVFPNLIAQDIVSVQAMPGPTTLIFYMDFLYGSNKGNIQAGQSAFDAMAGPTDSRFYSSDDIDREPIATVTAGGSAGPFAANLAYGPVQPGTVTIQADTVIGYDDGNNNITGVGIVSGAIDYQTGAITGLVFTNPVAGNTIIQSTYRYNSEGNENIPQVDLQLVSSPVTARHRKLRTRWSIEAQASLKSLHGLDAAAELAAFTAEEIKFEIDREVSSDLYNTAIAGHTNWTVAVPAGVGWAEHKLSFVDGVIEMSNMIFIATRRGQANFLILSVDAATVVESLPTFVADPGALNAQKSTGVVKIGVLNNRWVCYKDPFLGVGQPNRRVFFGGYKGSSSLDAGYVYAPYLPVYTTPTVYLDDFVGRKGIGTAYGKRTVNPRFYATGAII